MLVRQPTAGLRVPTGSRSSTPVPPGPGRPMPAAAPGPGRPVPAAAPEPGPPEWRAPALAGPARLAPRPAEPLALAAAAVSGLAGGASRAAGRATFQWPRPTGAGRRARGLRLRRLRWVWRRPRSSRCWRAMAPLRSGTCRPACRGCPWACRWKSRPRSWSPQCMRAVGRGGILMTTPVVPRKEQSWRRRGGL